MKLNTRTKKSSIKNINSCTVFQAKLTFNHISICLFRAMLYSVISEVLYTLCVCVYRHDTYFDSVTVGHYCVYNNSCVPFTGFYKL